MTKDNSHSHACQLNDVTPEDNIFAEVQGAESSSYKAEADTIGMKENLHMPKEVGEEGTLKEINNMVYEELLEKVANYEAELKFAKKKLESSQEEITNLKYENLTLVEELRTSEENMERMEHMLRSTFQEQHQLQDQLNLANQSIEFLQEELASQRGLVSELQQAITKTTNHLTDHCRETDELKLALHDAQQGFPNDRSQFQHQHQHYLNASEKEAPANAR